MTHSDWFYLAKFLLVAFVIFYLSVWFLESSGAGWKAGHAKLWKKPKGGNSSPFVSFGAS
jgi:hypothetical protein